MNKITGASMARTPHRLDNTNDNITSREIYLPMGYVVAGSGDTYGDEAGDDGTRSRSSTSGGGTFPLKMSRADDGGGDVP
jgi:hypothetical protein